MSDERLLDVWLVEGNAIYREVPAAEVATWVKQGRLRAEDMVQGPEALGWCRLGDYPGFAALCQAEARPPEGAEAVPVEGPPARPRAGRRWPAAAALACLFLLAALTGWRLGYEALHRLTSEAPTGQARAKEADQQGTKHEQDEAVGLVEKAGVEKDKAAASVGKAEAEKTVGKPGPDEVARSLAKLEDKLREDVTPRQRAGKGQGGSGEGDGKATLTQREKRMLRWPMRFTASSGEEYVKQLAALGAILAFPVTNGPDPEYQVVRDLKQRPAKLMKEDVSKLQGIYWIDDKPKSVQDVVRALGLKIAPRRFVAFMPAELEDELFKMERSYVEKVLRQKFDEDRIDETHFNVVFKGGKYRPELQSVTLRR